MEQTFSFKYKIAISVCLYSANNSFDNILDEADKKSHDWKCALDATIVQIRQYSL